MAPKKKEKDLKRSNTITLKLTDIELAVLNEAAGIKGFSRPEYLRKLLIEKQINHQIEVVADMNNSGAQIQDLQMEVDMLKGILDVLKKRPRHRLENSEKQRK